MDNFEKRMEEMVDSKLKVIDADLQLHLKRFEQAILEGVASEMQKAFS